MPNNYLSVLYKHIIQVKNKNVGLKVGGHKHTIPPMQKSWGHMPPLLSPPPFLRQWHVSKKERHRVWGGGGASEHFGKQKRGHAHFDYFQTKFPSLLIRFIMSIDGKYKTSYVDFFAKSIQKCF